MHEDGDDGHGCMNTEYMHYLHTTLYKSGAYPSITMLI